MAYLCFSLSSFGDKLVLSGPVNRRLYIFYVGCFSLLSLLLIPFIGLSIPSASTFLWIFLSAVFFMSGLYVLYAAVEQFEVSMVVPIVGAIQPIFILVFSWLTMGFTSIKVSSLLALSILLVASILISFEKKLNLTKKLLNLALLSAFLNALSLMFIKLVFLNLDFFHGLIWMGFLNFLVAMLCLLNNNFRQDIFVRRAAYNKKSILLVILVQLIGGLAGFLQNFAVFLAPFSSLAIINALRGIQYVFLFLLTLIFSVFLPRILKEEISKQAIIQKIMAILLIMVGLVILVLY